MLRFQMTISQKIMQKMSYWFVEITLQHHSKVGSSAIKMCNAVLVPLNIPAEVFEWHLLEQEIILRILPFLIQLHMWRKSPRFYCRHSQRGVSQFALQAYFVEYHESLLQGCVEWSVLSVKQTYDRPYCKYILRDIFKRPNYSPIQLRVFVRIIIGLHMWESV